MPTILHVSDVHFGPKHRPSAAWGLRDLIRSRAPALLVVSGDLTQRAKPYQFVQARDFLDSMRVPTLVVPGNHDVPLYRFWERAFDPYGAYRRHFSPALETTHRDDHVFVSGVNTAYNWTTKHGRIRPRRLAEIARQIEDVPAGLLKVLVAHHPMVAPPLFAGERPARGAAEAARKLAAMKIDLVLSGHVHQFFFAHSADYFPNLPRHFRILHAGTTTSGRGRGGERGRNSCNWIEVSAEEVRVEHLVWSGDGYDIGEKAAWERARGDQELS